MVVSPRDHCEMYENSSQILECNISALPKRLCLEQRQYKNDSIQSKLIPILKLPPFSPRRIGGKKARQFQNWNYF